MKVLAWIVWLGLSVAALLAAIQMAHAQDALPINPDVTQDNIKSTVCVPNWDKPIRPPVSVTNKIKFAKMAALGIDKSASATYELDHVVSLVLGGAPQDPRNLRIQKWYGDPVETPKDADTLDTQAHVKDVLEVRLHKLVCTGQITLDEAQHCIYDDWRACAVKYPSLSPASRADRPKDIP